MTYTLQVQNGTTNVGGTFRGRVARNSPLAQALFADYGAEVTDILTCATNANLAAGLWVKDTAGGQRWALVRPIPLPDAAPSGQVRWDLTREAR